MTYFYLKSAVRSILRKRVFSFLNIAGLTIGITVFLLVLEYFSYETGFDRFHEHGARLYRVNIVTAKGKSPSTVPALGAAMQSGIPGVKAAIRFGDNFNSGAVISVQPAGQAAPVAFQEQRCVFVDKSFLQAFTFPLVDGSNQLDNPHAVIITASIAKKLYGTAEPVGQTLQMHNQFGLLTCTVAGVVADPPRQSDIGFDYLFSTEILRNASYISGSDWASLDNWGSESFTTYVWLQPGADPVTIAAQASRLLSREAPHYTAADGTIGLQPVSELHLGGSFDDDNPTSGSRVMVYAILYLGMLVLLIAWINFINFSTAFALSQARNIGIHKVIGSGKRQIVGRYITESLLLNLAGLTLAFLLTDLVQYLFNYLTARPLSLIYLNHWSSWLIGGSILTTGIGLCGGYVGWVLAKFKPVSAMQFNDTGQLGNTLLRKGLVVFQFAISVLFIIATLVAYKQLDFMKRHNLGMTIDNLVVVNGPQIRDSSIRTEARAFRNDLQRLPFITAMSNTGSIPGPDFAHNYSADGVLGPTPSKGDDQKEYFISEVDDHYFPLLKIPLADGRNFTPDEVTRGYKAGKWIVNETAARSLGLPSGDVLHRIVKWQGKDWEIVGVIKDYHHRSLKEVIEPIIYIPQNNINRFILQMTPGELQRKITAVKDLYARYFPGNPFGYTLLRETYDTQYAEEQRAATIALSVSVFVILIACLGLVGLSVFTAKRRTKEIGIRKILGASSAQLFALLSKDFLALVLVAFLLAAPIAWILMSQWLQNFAYHIRIDVWTLLPTGLLVTGIALFTVSFQAIKAALSKPADAIRATD